MHTTAAEILQSLNIPQNIIEDGCGVEMNVFDRQQQPFSYDHQMCVFSLPDQSQQFQGLINIDHGLGNMFNIDYAIPRTISCLPEVAAATAEAAVSTGRGKGATTPEKQSSAVGKHSFKKRKVDQTRCQKVKTEAETRDKKMRGCAEEGDSKITEQHSNNSNGEPSVGAPNPKENSKVSEFKKPDFIHVRARRGQATDSHSLAERVRREKISERMKFLQDLVPGCNKIIGKAGMLDEIINYVQSLQRQVEFLSMKLSAINPPVDFDIDNLLNKEMFSAGLPSEIANPANLHFNQLPQQIDSCSGIEPPSISPPDMALRRTTSAPVSLQETLLDQSCFNQIQHSLTWDANLQNLYAMELEQGKSASFFSQPFAGYIEPAHVKLEI